jgi:hypothetical protein
MLSQTTSTCFSTASSTVTVPLGMREAGWVSRQVGWASGWCDAGRPGAALGSCMGEWSGGVHGSGCAGGQAQEWVWQEGHNMDGQADPCKTHLIGPATTALQSTLALSAGHE